MKNIIVDKISVLMWSKNNVFHIPWCRYLCHIVHYLKSLPTFLFTKLNSLPETKRTWSYIIDKLINIR